MIAMMNSRLVREADAQTYFELMAYLIRQFGAPSRPAVPSPLLKTVGMESLAWDPSDTRSMFHWAQDYFGEIKSACHMIDFQAELFPEGIDAEAEHRLADHRLSTLAAGRMPYRRSIVPSVTYDPWQCVTPGYFPAKIGLQLAQFRVAKFKPDKPRASLSRQKITLAAAAYNRQGFVLANLPEQVSDCLSQAGHKRVMSQATILNSLCFSICLALRIRRQSAEQITATYGTRMTQQFRKKIPQACQQIDSHAEHLELLQMLAEPKPQRASRAQIHQPPA
jgi:hypothetical protein